MTEPERIDRKEYPSFGECLYCGAHAGDVELTDEHIVPFSLGGNAVILDGSCKTCAKETTKIENEVGRKVWWDFRTNIGEQTRRPKERPKVGPFTVSINSAAPEVMTVPIPDRPFFTPMPVWGMPGLLTAGQPSANFQEYKAHVFYWVPPNIREILDLRHGDVAELPFPNFRIDHEKFARAIAKIAYCQTVAHYGLHGFRRLVLPDIILGRYSQVPYFVGCPLVNPEPPADPKVKHIVQLSVVDRGHLKLLLGKVRLFANSGTTEHGSPTYYVVCGAPLPGAKRDRSRNENGADATAAGIFTPGA